MAAAPRARADYDYLIKLLLIGDSVFRRDHPKLQTKSISPETEIRRTRREGKVVGDAAGVRWGRGASSSASEDGEQRDVHTLRAVRTSALERLYVLERVACFYGFLMAPSQPVSLPLLGLYSQKPIDFKIRTIELDGKRIKLQIWDTAGQERFRTITTAYYRGAMGILLVYDVTDESSFNNIRNWIRNIEQHASDNVNKVLVGNKADMDESKRAVPASKGQALADEYGIKFFETSAKTNLNVEEVFFSMARDIKQRLAESDSRGTEPQSLKMNEPGGGQAAQSSSCCG
ncbi:hypothetical protein ACLB2K_071627 [Fragaria x ananassa]